MTQINIYDYEAEIIEKWAEEYNTTVAEIITTLVEAVNNGDVELEDNV